MMTKLPYVVAYGRIPAIFGAIKKAAVPARFTSDFLSTKLGFKSTNDKSIISLMKKLGMLTPDGVPTEIYKDYRHSLKGPQVLGNAIKNAYKDLFDANEYAHTLSRHEVEDHSKRITGAGDDSRVVPAIAATFDELCKLANFDEEAAKAELPETSEPQVDKKTYGQSAPQAAPGFPKKLGISYTINLNLPASTDIEVFNAIFKSLRENLLHE